MDNVFITLIPQDSREDVERHLASYAENVRRYLAGEPLLWVVDKNAGY
jgi:hypothetical protein